MNWLQALWLRFVIRDLEHQVAELHGNIGHFLDMVEHKQNLLREKRLALQNLELDRP